MTHETRIKDAVNMEDLICLLATVRTLKVSMKVFVPCWVHDRIQLLIILGSKSLADTCLPRLVISATPASVTLDRLRRSTLMSLKRVHIIIGI